MTKLNTWNLTAWHVDDGRITVTIDDSATYVKRRLFNDEMRWYMRNDHGVLVDVGNALNKRLDETIAQVL